jgi:hypothetical protein
VGVEKVCDWIDLVQAAGVGAGEFFFLSLSGDRQPCCGRAKEAHQSLDVLRSRRQEELLPHRVHRFAQRISKERCADEGGNMFVVTSPSGAWRWK